MSYIVKTEDGRLVAFNPNDYRFIVNHKDLVEGKYEPQIETTRTDGGKVKMRITQLMPPLVKTHN